MSFPVGTRVRVVETSSHDAEHYRCKGTVLQHRINPVYGAGFSDTLHIVKLDIGGQYTFFAEQLRRHE